MLLNNTEHPLLGVTATITSIWEAEFPRFGWQGLCLESEGSRAFVDDFWMSCYFLALGTGLSCLLPIQGSV